LVEHRAPAQIVQLLAEVADRETLRHAHLALVRLLLARDQPEQRRLPRAIRSHQPHLLPRVELERRLDEQCLVSVTLADVGERDHEPGRLARTSERRHEVARNVRWDEKADPSYAGDSLQNENRPANRRSAMKKSTTLTIGMDLGDKHSELCVLDA